MPAWVYRVVVFRFSLLFIGKISLQARDCGKEGESKLVSPGFGTFSEVWTPVKGRMGWCIVESWRGLVTKHWKRAKMGLLCTLWKARISVKSNVRQTFKCGNACSAEWIWNSFKMIWRTNVVHWRNVFQTEIARLQKVSPVSHSTASWSSLKPHWMLAIMIHLPARALILLLLNGSRLGIFQVKWKLRVEHEIIELLFAPMEGTLRIAF